MTNTSATTITTTAMTTASYCSAHEKMLTNPVACNVAHNGLSPQTMKPTNIIQQAQETMKHNTEPPPRRRK
eukprot:2182951-Pyramimonas_sp.AAC.1